MMRTNLLSAFVFLLGANLGGPAFADDQPFVLDGVYQGSLVVDDGGTTMTIPIQASLALTGERAIGPDGNPVQVIDGAFLVDGEGGAFPFSKVTFDIRESKLDMRYNRTQANANPSVPSSFRLIGTFDSSQTLSGRALSGSRGPIGTFTLKRTSQISFVRKARYEGKWRGDVALTRGGTAQLELTLLPASGSTTNPLDFEFDYTPTKLGRIYWNNVSLVADSIFIDYLRGLVTMRKTNSSGGNGTVFEFSIDRTSGEAVGSIRSSYGGEIGQFRLPPSPPDSEEADRNGESVGDGQPGYPHNCDPMDVIEVRTLFKQKDAPVQALAGTDWLDFVAMPSDHTASPGYFHALGIQTSGAGCYSIAQEVVIENGGRWQNLKFAGRNLFTSSYFHGVIWPQHGRILFEALLANGGTCDVEVKAYRFSEVPTGIPTPFPRYPPNCF